MKQNLLLCVLLILFAFSLSVSTFAQGLPTRDPGELDFCPERLERINAKMQDYVDRGKFAGFITAVARKGVVVHYEKFGVKSVETKKPMEFDTIFRIYSMSKPITSVAVMMLYEEGHFQLDDPVSKFIPEMKDLKVYQSGSKEDYTVEDLKRPITIRHLLTHTSGLAYGFGDNVVDEIYKANYDGLFPWDGTLKDMMNALCKIPLLHQPGAHFEYSMSTDVLGYLVEVISGQLFDAFLKERIFDPLDMKDTAFFIPKEKVSRFSALHRLDKQGKLEAQEEEWGEKYLNQDIQFYSGGGGLVSTASDYMRFGQMLLNKGQLDGKRILGRRTVKLMTSNHLRDKQREDRGGDGFGLGFSVKMDIPHKRSMATVGQYGWSGAASTDFWVSPQEEMIGLLLVQYMPFNSTIHHEYRTLVYQALVD